MDTQMISPAPGVVETQRELHSGGIAVIPPHQNGGSLKPATFTEAPPFDLDSVPNIPLLPRPEGHVVALGTTPSIGAEKFLSLRHRLMLMRQRRPLQSLVVTSSVPQEGKTVVSANLAVTLARTSHRVLLVDADMRKPSVQQTLGLPANLAGLSEYLEGHVEVSSALRRVTPSGLYVMAAGKPSDNPVSLLQNSRMRELIARAAVTFDWVIFDSPPVNAFVDAPCLATQADGVLLVARAGVSHASCVKQSLSALEGAFIAGIVLNGKEDLRAEGYYSYYYRTQTPVPHSAEARRISGKTNGVAHG